MSSAKRIKMGRANYGHTDIARLMASATGRSQTECQGMLGAAFQACLLYTSPSPRDS